MNDTASAEVIQLYSHGDHEKVDVFLKGNVEWVHVGDTMLVSITPYSADLVSYLIMVVNSVEYILSEIEGATRVRGVVVENRLLLDGSAEPRSYNAKVISGGYILLEDLEEEVVEGKEPYDDSNTVVSKVRSLTQVSHNLEDISRALYDVVLHVSGEEVIQYTSLGDTPLPCEPSNILEHLHVIEERMRKSQEDMGKLVYHLRSQLMP